MSWFGIWINLNLSEQNKFKSNLNFRDELPWANPWQDELVHDNHYSNQKQANKKVQVDDTIILSD